MINEKLILTTLRDLSELSVSQIRATAALSAVLSVKLPDLTAGQREMFSTNADSLNELARLQAEKVRELNAALDAPEGDRRN